MSTLLKYSGDAASAPRHVLTTMEMNGSKFVTWVNKQAGTRFIAQKSTIEKMAHNKFCMNRAEHLEIKDSEVIALGSSLTVDEVLFEMDANNCDEVTFKSGFSEKTKVTRKTIDVLSEVLYNSDFDCSILFKNQQGQ